MINENLKQCETCNQEIAKSAKTCPKCGAKNGSNIFFTIIKYWITIAVIVQIVRFIFPDLLPVISKDIFSNKVPECNTTDGVIKVFNDAPYQSLVNLKLVFIEKTNEISYDSENNIRICEAVGHLNNADELNITYKFEAKENGQYLIHVQPK